MRLHSLKLGLAGGILSGLFHLIVTLISMSTGYGSYLLAQWADIYPGYSFTILGSIIGLIFGFIFGFVSLFLLGWLYNLLVGKGRSKS